MQFGNFQLDPELREALEYDASFFEAQKYDDASEAEKLAISETLSLHWNKELPSVDRIQSELLPFEDRQVEVRTYFPKADSEDRYIIWVHGGGWNEGSLDIYDRLMRVLANAAAAPVIGIGYTKVPTAVFPTQLHELHSAYRFIEEKLFPARAKRMVGGYSAGANLALSSMVLFNEALGDNYFDKACLVCGFLDYDFSSGSHKEYDGYFGNSCKRLCEIVENYAQGAIARQDPSVFPVSSVQTACQNFLVISAAHDMLKDDSYGLTGRLQSQKLKVRHLNIPNVTHIFLQRSSAVKAAHQAIVDMGEYFAS